MDRFYRKVSHLLAERTQYDPCFVLVRASQSSGAAQHAGLHCCAHHQVCLALASTHLQPHWPLPCQSPFQTIPGNRHCCHTCLEDGWLPGPDWRVSCGPYDFWSSPLALCLFTEHGFVGYSEELMFNNTLPDYSQGESFFTVFGVFFPAATGTVFFILPVFPSTVTSWRQAEARGFPLDCLAGQAELYLTVADSVWSIPNVQAFLQHLEFYTLLFTWMCSSVSLWSETAGQLHGLMWWCKSLPTQDKAQALIFANAVRYQAFLKVPFKL